MKRGNKIEKKLDVNEFMKLIANYHEKDLNITQHTFFRLNEKQRKIFKDKIIKEIILSQTPVLAGIQYNGNYAVFYKYENNIMRIILDIQPDKIYLVTFYIIDKKQMLRL